MQNDSASDHRPAVAATELWIGPAIAVSLVAIMFAPRLTHGAQLVLVFVPIAVLWLSQGMSRLLPLPTLASGLSIFGAYLMINAAFAVDPLEAYGKVAYFWILLLTSFLALSGLAKVSSDRLGAMGRSVLLGFALGAVFLAIEAVFNQPFRRFLFNVLPATRMAPKHLAITADSVTHIGLYTLNRNLAILSLALWPSILLLRSHLSAERWRVAAAASFAVTATAVFSSEHETSMLAILFSSAAFLGMLVAPKIMRALILSGWLVATLAIVPIAAVSYAAGLHTWSAIPQTGRHRIVIWGVTASEIKKAPVLGVGVGSTKELDEKAAPTAAKPADHGYALRTGRHAHNIFMQTWFELGAVGALLFSAVGIAGLIALSRLHSCVQPYAYAAFVSAVLIGAFSWGMWQTWFMAAYAIWAMLLGLSIEVADRRHQSGVSSSAA